MLASAWKQTSMGRKLSRIDSFELIWTDWSKYRENWYLFKLPATQNWCQLRDIKKYFYLPKFFLRRIEV